METKSYHQYTNCDTRYARIKCLDFIVAAIEQEEAKKSRKLKILEIGCGNGDICLPIASLGHEVLATDVDLKSIEVARRVNRFPTAHFFVADGEHLVVKKRFDVVVATEVLEHVPTPSKLLAGCRELLEPDGLFVLTVPNGYGPFEFGVSGLILAGKMLRLLQLRRLLDSIKDAFFEGGKRNARYSSNPDSYHVQHFTLKRVQTLLADSDFETVTIGHSDFLTPVLELPLRFKMPDRLHYWDWWLADRLPHGMVSGWYFLCRKT